MKIKSLYLENYRGIERALIPFSDRLTVLTGPHNTGKHTVFDAITLPDYIYNSAGKDIFLEEYFVGDGRERLRRQGATGPVILSFTMFDHGREFVYTMSITEKEVVDYVNTGNEEDKKKFLDFIAKYKFHPYLEVGTLLNRCNKEQKKEVISILNRFFKNEVKDLIYEDDNVVLVKTPYFDEPLSCLSYSPAFNRIMRYILMVVADNDGCWLMLEDPEQALDARIMGNLICLFEDYVYRTGKQVFIIAHDPFFVSHALPGDTVLSSKVDGKCSFINANQIQEIVDLWEDEEPFWYVAYIDLQ